MLKNPQIIVSEEALLDGFNRGDLSDVEVILENGNRYKLYFITPLLISQYFSFEQTQRFGTLYYFEKNLVIVPSIDFTQIENAINKMIEQSSFEEMAIEKEIDDGGFRTEDQHL